MPLHRRCDGPPERRCENRLRSAPPPILGPLVHVLVGLLIALGFVVAGCAADGEPPIQAPVEPPAGAASEAPTRPAPDTKQGPARPPRSTTRGPVRQAPVGLQGEVTDVVDGDTIKVRARGFETTVRLIGIDTPETRHPSQPVQCFGPEASQRVRRILPLGQQVRLQTDSTQDRRDRYGRLLAYVYKPSRSGPLGSVNYSLVATGYAKVYIYQGIPFRFASAFQAAERRARAADRGLWGPPCEGDTRSPAPSAAPAPERDAPPSGGSGAGCDPNYAGACVAPYPPDVDCADVSGSVRVVGSDPHRLDGNGDGVGCE